MDHCPRCNVSIGAEMDQCPRCGIFFSKWEEREYNISSGNLKRYDSIANATSSGFNWTILIIVCTVVGVVIYFMGRGQ